MPRRDRRARNRALFGVARALTTVGNVAGTRTREHPLVNMHRYRSYVVRVRRQLRGRDGAEVVRAEVEDLLGGSRAQLEDERARTLAADLEAFVARIDEIDGDDAEPGR